MTHYAFSWVDVKPVDAYEVPLFTDGGMAHWVIYRKPPRSSSRDWAVMPGLPKFVAVDQAFVYLVDVIGIKPGDKIDSLNFVLRHCMGPTLRVKYAEKLGVEVTI